MARVIQISDPHIVAPGKRVSARLDTAALLQECVARIGSDLTRIGPVDAVIVTGDISDDGCAESYALFREIMAPLSVPYLIIPGNHDQREPMRAAFGELLSLPATGRLNWASEMHGVHVIGLDTLIEGQGGGILDQETLEFLDQALAHAGSDPVLLAMHHPPFSSGIRFMDAIGLKGIDGLDRVLASSSADIRIVCGHVHNVMVGAIGGVVALSGPATCSTFDADFRPDAPVGFMTAPGGYIVHDWEGGFRSIHVGAGIAAGPFPF